MALRYFHLTDDRVDRSVEKLNTAFYDAITPEIRTGLAEDLRGAA